MTASLVHPSWVVRLAWTFGISFPNSSCMAVWCSLRARNPRVWPLCISTSGDCLGFHQAFQQLLPWLDLWVLWVFKTPKKSCFTSETFARATWSTLQTSHTHKTSSSTPVHLSPLWNGETSFGQCILDHRDLPNAFWPHCKSREIEMIETLQQFMNIDTRGKQ